MPPVAEALKIETAAVILGLPLALGFDRATPHLLAGERRAVVLDNRL